MTNLHIHSLAHSKLGKRVEFRRVELKRVEFHQRHFKAMKGCFLQKPSKYVIVRNRDEFLEV